MKDTLSKTQFPIQPGPEPDGELVAKAKDGDLEAMDQLISRHHGSVFRTAVGILGDEDAASDVAQETFLKAFKGLGKFRGDASFKTWVLAIAANEARGFLRKAGRRRELPLEKVGPVSSEETPVDETMAREEDTKRMRELLSQLPEKQR
ncbi:MAG: RNA polymerase sigma factor, partial [Gemmatimonadetes bacterium]|nr:RNA polymerase sigma factor [Gemmatimonadota bacterium]